MPVIAQMIKVAAVKMALKYVEWRVEQSVKSDKVEDAAVREWLRKIDAKYEGEKDETKD